MYKQKYNSNKIIPEFLMDAPEDHLTNKLTFFRCWSLIDDYQCTGPLCFQIRIRGSNSLGPFVGHFLGYGLDWRPRNSKTFINKRLVKTFPESKVFLQCCIYNKLSYSPALKPAKTFKRIFSMGPPVRNCRFSGGQFILRVNSFVA